MAQEIGFGTNYLTLDISRMGVRGEERMSFNNRSTINKTEFSASAPQ